MGALLEDDWLASTRCFVAASPLDERLEKPLGFLFAYNDEKDEDERPQHSIVAIVHPVHRRTGIFRRMVRVIKDALPPEPSERTLVFEFSGQSATGMACAAAMGLKQTANNCDNYMICTRLAPPSPTRTLPEISLTRVGVECLEEILAIWMQERPENNEEKEREILRKDLTSELQCFLLRKDERTIGSLTFTVSEDDVYLMNVIIVPEARCRGYGEAMVRAATLHSLQELKKPRVCLETTNPDAVRVYQRVGFAVANSWESWREIHRAKAAIAP